MERGLAGRPPGSGRGGGSKGGGGKGGNKGPTPGTSQDDGGQGGTGGAGGTSGTGGSIGRRGGRRQPSKRGRDDDDDDDDDPNKRRKMGDDGKPPRHSIACKEPRKQGTAYPPINRNLPILYISRNKERTALGFRVLDWTEAQKQKIHQVRLQGRQVKPHRYQAGDGSPS